MSHFLPVYDPSIDQSIKESTETGNAFRGLPLKNMAMPDGYKRFLDDGSTDMSTVSGMDVNVHLIKGQKLFRLPEGFSYRLRKNCVPFADFASETQLSKVDQLGLSPYNSIFNQAGSMVAMPPVSQDQANFWISETDSCDFVKAARTISLNDSSVFVNEIPRDFYDFDDEFFEWDNCLYNTCNYHGERNPSDPDAAQGTISCRLAVPDNGGELIFNKFLFFITARDENGQRVGNAPMLFAECAFNRKYFLASSKSQIENESTAVMNSFECVVTIKYKIGETSLEGVVMNENQWVSNESVLGNSPEEIRVWRQGSNPRFKNPPFEPGDNFTSENSRLQNNYFHMFQQAYSGDVGIGTMYPKARLHLTERTESQAVQNGENMEASFFQGIYPHIKLGDKHRDIGFEFYYMDALLNSDEDNSPACGMLNITPSEKLIRNGIALFRNARAMGARGAMAFGENSVASGDDTMAFGQESEALNEHNIAIGWKSKSIAYLGSAIGHESYAGQLTRLPNVPGFSRSASYAHGHCAKSDSGYAAGVNAEARGFWYAQTWDDLEGTQAISEGGEGSSKLRPHGHDCGCPVCMEAIGHLMLAAEYENDCSPESQASLGEIITKQFGSLFSYAIGKNVLSGSMSGAMGVNVAVKAYSSVGLGRNINISHYYSTAIGSEIEMPGSNSRANMVFAKWMKLGNYAGNGGNTILGQQIEIARMSNSLVLAYGLNVNLRGRLDNVIINAVNSRYTDVSYGYSWNSPNFIDMSIRSNLRVVAFSSSTYWRGINLGIDCDVSTRSVNVGVNNHEIGGANVMFGREIYGTNLVAAGKDIYTSSGNAFGFRLYDASPFGTHNYGTMVGHDLHNLGGTVIGEYSKSSANYYYSEERLPNFGFNPVLTVAGGTALSRWHGLELGRSSFNKPVSHRTAAGGYKHHNFGEVSEKLALWNLIPAGTAMPTTADLLADNSDGESLRHLIRESGGGFLVADNFTGFLYMTGRGEGYEKGKPGAANSHAFGNSVGYVLGGSYDNTPDGFGPIPWKGASFYKIPRPVDSISSIAAVSRESSVSMILGRFFKLLWLNADKDDAAPALYWLNQILTNVPMTCPWEKTGLVEHQHTGTLLEKCNIDLPPGGWWADLPV